MSRMIGGTRVWIWWLAGLFCALAFEGAARAAEFAARYGIRPRPEPVTDENVTAEQRAQAEKLVDEHLGGTGGAQAPSAEEEKQIARLVAELGADGFTVREAASRAVVRFGAKALAQLREAQKGRDAEVVQRAEAAIAEITSGGASRTVEELRKIRGAAAAVIAERRRKLQAAAYAADLGAAALDGQGKAAEAEAKRAEKSLAERKVQELDKLLQLVVYGATIGVERGRMPGPQPAYGVKMIVVD